MEKQGTLTLRFMVIVDAPMGDERDVGECLDILDNYNLEDDIETALRDQVSAVNRANIYLVQLDKRFEQIDRKEPVSEAKAEKQWEAAWEAITTTQN
ncbi:MAG: hypothetical protein V3W44_03780 [Dehalococcoidales bacterium]